MIELSEKDLVSPFRKSSKGNQLKWRSGDWWYKADYLGYEGLSEYMTSQLLRKSTLESGEYILYEPVEIKWRSTVMNGVKSRHFLHGSWQIITLERLFDTRYHQSMHESVFRIPNHEERFDFLVRETERMTGLRDFGRYMTKLFEIDALFLNEDRHLHNIAVLMDDQGNFNYCPAFDFGAGLLSDTRMDYPMAGDLYDEIGSVKAKTISESFDEQLEIAEGRYGVCIKFCFTDTDTAALLEDVGIYDENVRNRVYRIVLEQKRKYQYLFADEKRKPLRTGGNK